MKTRIRITPGMKFHRLTVLGFSRIHVSPAGARRSIYLCKCDCGNETEVPGGNLNGQHPVKSCGCLNAEQMEHLKTHGRTHNMRKTRTYKAWAGVVARGTGTDAREKYYDRGIRVTDSWLKFENFFADMGVCPSDQHSIDRIDNDGGYSKGNCRWATPTQQARNTRNTIWVTYRGERISLADLAERFDKKPSVVRVRLQLLGWDLDQALETPVRPISTKN